MVAVEKNLRHSHPSSSFFHLSSSLGIFIEVDVDQVKSQLFDFRFRSNAERTARDREDDNAANHDSTELRYLLRVRADNNHKRGDNGSGRVVGWSGGRGGGGVGVNPGIKARKVRKYLKGFS